MPKAISAIVTPGGASSASFRTSRAITAGFGILRSVSKITCRGRSKLQSLIDLPVFANDGLQIEIAAILARKARVEGECRLAPRLSNFISFERALHDIGDRSMFAAR